MQKALAGLRRIELDGLRWRVFDAKDQVCTYHHFPRMPLNVVDYKAWRSLCVPVELDGKKILCFSNSIMILVFLLPFGKRSTIVYRWIIRKWGRFNICCSSLLLNVIFVEIFSTWWNRIIQIFTLIIYPLEVMKFSKNYDNIHFPVGPWQIIISNIYRDSREG